MSTSTAGNTSGLFYLIRIVLRIHYYRDKDCWLPYGFKLIFFVPTFLYSPSMLFNLAKIGAPQECIDKRYQLMHTSEIVKQLFFPIDWTSRYCKSGDIAAERGLTWRDHDLDALPKNANFRGIWIFISFNGQNSDMPYLTVTFGATPLRTTVFQLSGVGPGIP